MLGQHALQHRSQIGSRCEVSTLVELGGQTWIGLDLREQPASRITANRRQLAGPGAQPEPICRDYSSNTHHLIAPETGRLQP